MQTATIDVLRQQLDFRRARLQGAIAQSGPEADLVTLLQQVDSALGRLGTPEYGRCLVCKESVAEEDLLSNPILRYCLCDLTAEQQQAFQHDLDLAQSIQGALLPDPHLRTPEWEAFYRYESAGVVSGDYCDLWARDEDDGSVFFAVGDVSGKGVAASLVMAHLQAAFRSLLGAGLPLSELVERVNRQLLQATLPSHYVTLACGRASRDGEVEIVNAGHCPPLVARAGGVEAIGPTGFPLGLFTDRPYEVESLTLREGEVLVLYTDGLTEARGADGDEYGQRRVEDLLRDEEDYTPRQLVRAVRLDLERFRGDATRTDDLTILALRKSTAAQNGAAA